MKELGRLKVASLLRRGLVSKATKCAVMYHISKEEFNKLVERFLK